MHNLNINGYELLEWLNGALPVKPPILSITSPRDISNNLEYLKKLGVCGVITKGFSPEQIVYRVNRLLFGNKVSNREDARVPVSIPLDYTIGEESFTSSLLNISSTGLFLYTKKELMPGTSLQIKFLLAGAERAIALKGTVRWSTKPSGGEDYFYGAGVIFTSISDEDKEIVGKFVRDELKKIDPEMPAALSETLISDAELVDRVATKILTLDEF